MDNKSSVEPALARVADPILCARWGIKHEVKWLAQSFVAMIK